MIENCENSTEHKTTVRLILFFTEGLTYSEAEIRLKTDQKDLISARRYVNEKDKLLHLVSAYLKKKYVGLWTVNEFGKPISERVCFNVSHCNGAVALVLSDKDVGVDIENVRPVSGDLVRYVSDTNEIPYVKNDKDFFRLWTAKESLSKAHGKGLNKEVKTIPSFPFEGVKTYLGEKYCARQLEEGDYVITVTRKGEEFFELNIETEKPI